MRIEAKTKLAELPINWKEAYTERTTFLKDMYEDIVGVGSYFRWEGRNANNGDEYYVVVSPANIHKPTSEFFAGVRKLPSDYAAYGEYFSEMRDAIKYAHDTWGTPVPSDMRHYDSRDLKGLNKRTKEWKKERSDKVAHSSSDFVKESMARRVGDVDWSNREGYAFLNVKNIMGGKKPDFGTYKKLVKEERKLTPAGEKTPLEKAFARAKEEKNRWTQEILTRYGIKDPDFYQLWVAHKPSAGTQSSYIFTVGPHATNPKLPNGNKNPYYKTDENGRPIAKFGIFHRAITTVTEEQVLAHRAKLLKKIENLYPWMREEGIVFGYEDLEVPAEISGDEEAVSIGLNAEGKKKWANAVLKWYQESVEVETSTGDTLLVKNTDLPRLEQNGIQIVRTRPAITDQMKAAIERNPERGWASALKQISTQYINSWNDAYARAKQRATDSGFKGNHIDESPEVSEFLDTTPEPPQFNANIMRVNVGSRGSGPIYFKPPYMIKKKSYFEKPDLNGRTQLELLDTKGLEVGDAVTLVAKVSTNERYDNGRVIRKKVEIPIGKVTQVNHENNTVSLDLPISYNNTNDFLPWAIVTEHASGDKYYNKYAYNSLSEAYNALRGNVSPHIQVPEFTRDVDDNFLSEAIRRKELNQPAPRLQSRMLSQDEQSRAMSQMEQEYAPAAEVPEDIVGEEESKGIDIAESLISPPTPSVSPARVETENAQDLPEEDYAEFIHSPVAPAKKTSPKTTKAPKKVKVEETVVPDDSQSLYANAILKLVKLAEIFDANQECDKSEEVHKILRKYF